MELLELDRPSTEVVAGVARRAGRFRRWVRAALKPLFVVGIAGLLAVSLTVTTTQNAEANPLLIPPVIFTGSTIMTLGEVTGATALLGPVGWGLLGVAAVGAGLYYTQDYWLPYVNGTFGQPDPVQTQPTTTAKNKQTVALLSRSPDGNTFALSVTSVSPPTTAWYAYYGVIGKCKKTADNSIGYMHSGGYYALAANQNVNGTPTLTPCPLGYTTIGYMIAGGAQSERGSFTPNLSTTQGTAPARFDDSWGGGFGYATKNVITGGSWDANSPAAFDPNDAAVTYKTSVECIKADGTKFTLIAESTGDQKGVKVPSCAAAEAGAHGTGKIKVEGTPPGSTTPQTLLDRAAATATPSDYPLCSPAKAGPGCTLSVWIDGKECVVGNWDCTHWKEIDQTRVQCKFGPYAGLAVSSCNPLERAYEEGGVPATEANTDGNTATRADIDPNGSTVPKNSTGTGTGTSTVPLTGTNPGTQPGTDPANCLATGWSWDPVSWVMVPVQCATQWAFVPPRARIDTDIDFVRPKLEARGIQPFITPFMTNFGNLGGSGCMGPAISLASIHINQTLYPFNACTEPLAPIATGVNAFFSLSIILQGGMSCIRGVAAAFGFNWGFGEKEE
jgi:hypothetical protein